MSIEDQLSDIYETTHKQTITIEKLLNIFEQLDLSDVNPKEKKSKTKTKVKQEPIAKVEQEPIAKVEQEPLTPLELELSKITSGEAVPKFKDSHPSTQDVVNDKNLLNAVLNIPLTKECLNEFAKVMATEMKDGGKAIVDLMRNSFGINSLNDLSNDLYPKFITSVLNVYVETKQ